MATAEAITAASKADIVAAATARESAQFDVFGLVIDTPTVLLFAMVGFFVYIVWDAKRSGLSWADAFRDDANQKASFMRLGIIYAILVTSWQVMVWTLRITPSEEFVKYMSTLYIFVWSGAKIVDKLVDIAAVKFGLKTPPPPPSPPAP